MIMCIYIRFVRFRKQWHVQVAVSVQTSTKKWTGRLEAHHANSKLWDGKSPFL